MKSELKTIAITTVILLALGAAIWFVIGNPFMANKDATVAITEIQSGVITQIRHDCGPVETLAEDGSVKTEKEAICDGGTFVVVDGVDIQTSSGYTIVEDSFHVDISSLKPGDAVAATYVTDEYEYASLDCEECFIVKQ